jgi:hypothetical protein
MISRIVLVATGMAIATALLGCTDWCKEDCKKLGNCRREGLMCYATSDSDCQQSEICRESGACKAKDKGCVVGGTAPTIRAEPAPTAAPLPIHAQPAQEPKATAECRNTPECKNAGACTLVGGSCEVACDADCKGSLLCSQFGACWYDKKNDICAPRSEADCQTSLACKQDGWCFLRFDGRLNCHLKTHGQAPPGK